MSMFYNEFKDNDHITTILTCIDTNLAFFSKNTNIEKSTIQDLSNSFKCINSYID